MVVCLSNVSKSPSSCELHWRVECYIMGSSRLLRCVLAGFGVERPVTSTQTSDFGLSVEDPISQQIY